MFMYTNQHTISVMILTILVEYSNEGNSALEIFIHT